MLKCREEDSMNNITQLSITIKIQAFSSILHIILTIMLNHI